ncbi:MAG: cation diffusion facilitator family transporter [Alphaproteobacteria bacterium]|nr:cation diffusion facilitator family transporter [Alphaproteobacteria bacterium]MBN9567529.1 cation diffusion facilitator family transporter [Alphaproteobacteria bacterium]MBN9570605.1 cation diffusion facilitator family transporter [Alphaproteobacteria bacterium]MBN9579217.1 cation diffusion facilitator family transporter [Alphaproteobacteria bacterium]
MAHAQTVPVTAAAHSGLMRRAALFSLALAVTLIAIKTIAYFATESVSMLASLADSGLDFVASLLNFLAIRHALEPADAEHRFGHGKAEPLSGLAQGAFIAGSATFLVIESVNRILAPQPVAHETLGVAVMVFSIAGTVALIFFQQRVVRETGSLAVGADRAHYASDLVVNLGVIAGIVLASRFGLPLADPIIAILIAGVLAGSAWRVFRVSYDQLMDRELPDAEREKIKAIILQHDAVRALHDLRTRMAGVNTFIQFHIELDPGITLLRAHTLSDAVEADLQKAFPNAEILIHQDPAGFEMPPALAQS